jgi:hypothetical protein
MGKGEDMLSHRDGQPPEGREREQVSHWATSVPVQRDLGDFTHILSGAQFPDSSKV